MSYQDGISVVGLKDWSLWANECLVLGDNGRASIFVRVEPGCVLVQDIICIVNKEERLAAWDAALSLHRGWIHRLRAAWRILWFKKAATGE